jgi:uncharacterized membrane protein/heme-degrading monooxygenase HmoA
VLVNIFTLDKADEQAFLKAWQDDAVFMKQQPGFISTQLHRAIGESSCYLNYAVWETTAHFTAAFTNPGFRAKLSVYPSSAVATPHLFQKVAVTVSALRKAPGNAMKISLESRNFPLALELVTAIGRALMAGFLFNMSVVTAPALNALSPESALAAWKGINSTVRNPLFAGTAFGTALLVVACCGVAWRSRLRVWCLSFALLYLTGVIGTTFAVENGVNTAIIAATQPPPDLSRMLSTWLAGNHVRALSALAAFLLAWLGFRRSD